MSAQVLGGQPPPPQHAIMHPGQRPPPPGVARNPCLPRIPAEGWSLALQLVSALFTILFNLHSFESQACRRTKVSGGSRAGFAPSPARSARGRSPRTERWTCDQLAFPPMRFAGKGGKNRRRGKNESEEKRELIFKEDGQGAWVGCRPGAGALAWPDGGD